MKTTESTYETEAANVLGRARNAILEGGYDDLAEAAAKLAGLIKEQESILKDGSLSPLVKSLIAIADILAADTKYLPAAIAAYGDAAHLSAGRDSDLNKQSITGILEKAEFLPNPADRINAYQLAFLGAPIHSSLESSLTLFKMNGAFAWLSMLTTPSFVPPPWPEYDEFHSVLNDLTVAVV